MPEILGKVHQMTLNHFDMFKVIYANMHTLPMPKMLSTLHYDEPFLSYALFQKSATIY